MVCPLHLSTAARRLPPAPAAKYPTDERQQQAFQQWFAPPTPPEPSDLDAFSHPPHQVLTLELVPYQARLESLGQFSHSRLTLRLTNGPLAGLEISAWAQGSLLHLQVRTCDPQQFAQLAGTVPALEKDLTQRFKRPITLEVRDACAPTE